MAILTKNQLSASNASSFPDNTSGAITPQILRDFNTSIIDTMVDSLNTGSYAILTGSNDFTQQNNFTSISASSFVSASEFIGNGNKITGITASISLPILDEGIPQGNATSMNFTGSNISATIVAGTAVVQVNTSDLVSTASFNGFSQSVDSRLDTLEAATSSYANSASVAAVDAAQQSQINALIAATSSLALTSLNQFTASQETKDATLATYTASVDTKFSNIGAQSSSWDNTNLNAFSASQLTKDGTLANVTASLQQQLTNIGSQSGSWITESETSSFARTNTANTFTGINEFDNNVLFGQNQNIINGSLANLTISSVSTNGLFLTSGNDITLTPGAGFNIIPKGPVSSSAAITASFFVGDGSQLTNIPGGVPLTSLNAFTQSQEAKDSALATYTGSVNSQLTASAFKFDNIGAQSGSWITESETGSFARTNVDNNFTANQTFTNITAVSASFQYVQTTYETSSVIYSSGSNILGDNITDTQTLNGLVVVSGSQQVTGSAGFNGAVTFVGGDVNFTDQARNINIDVDGTIIKGQKAVLVSQSLDVQSTFTASLQQGYVWAGNGNGRTYEVPTSSFVSSTLTGSFATTGSNNFIGVETINDVVGVSSGEVYLLARSGSLILGNATATPTYAALSHLSSSQINANTNLIFKTNTNTADTIISGSGNIFVNPSAPTAGFKRFVGTTGNIQLNASNVPQISSSMAYPITMNNNILTSNGTTITMRGPVSSSAWTIAGNIINGTTNIGTSATLHAQSLVAGVSMTQNNIPGTLAIIANQTGVNFNVSSTISANYIAGTATLAMTGSVIGFSNNIVNDAGTSIVNGYYSSSVGLGSLAVNRNNFAGQVQTLIVSGALPSGVTAQPSYSDNAMFGGSNTIFTNVSAAPISGGLALHSALRNLVAGHQLIITGSSALGLGDTYGSAFVGRWNANDGVRNKTNTTIFAVGTGVNDTTRKTGFLIDSGSNTFIEGTLNVSGSTTLTGSLLISASNNIQIGETSVGVSSFNKNSFNINTSKVAGIDAFTQLYAETGSKAAMYMGVYDDPAFNTDVEFAIFTDANGTTFRDFDNGTAFDYVPFMSLEANVGNNPSPRFTRGLQITGSLEVTGSAYGNVVSMSVSSNTASMDFSKGNYFELTASVSPIRIEVSNLKGGVTSTLSLIATTGSTINWSSNVQQPSGSAYTASVSGSNDILSFVAFNTSKVNVVSTLKMI